MVIDAWKGYLELATGVGKTTRAKALATARLLLAQAGLEDVAADATERVGKLADEILSASAANRQILTSFVTHEVDLAVGRLGLARREDLDALRTELAALRASLEPGSGAAVGPPAQAKKSPVKKAPAKRAPRKAAASADPVVSAAAQVPARKAPAKKTAAKKAPSRPAADSLDAAGPAAETS